MSSLEEQKAKALALWNYGREPSEAREPGRLSWADALNRTPAAESGVTTAPGLTNSPWLDKMLAGVLDDVRDAARARATTS